MNNTLCPLSLFIKTVVQFIHTHSASLVQTRNTDLFTESTYSLSNAVQLMNGFFTAYYIITVVHVTVSLEGREKAPKIVTRFTKEAFTGPPYDILQTMEGHFCHMFWKIKIMT